MHMGMPMMHEEGESHGNMEPALQKEVTIGELRAVATFPPLDLGKEAIFTLRLVNARTSAPISGAEVYLHAEYAHSVDSLSNAGEIPHQIIFDQDAEEGREPGLYSVTFSSSQTGIHRFMFHVTALNGQPLQQGLVIEATRTVTGLPHDHGIDMVGGNNTVTYVIVGAVAMGAMMAAMLFARGGMF
jgi:hypothetical protein